MYVIDLLARLSPDAEPMRHASVFHHYGAAIVEGIDPIRFLGLMLASLALTVLGAVLFDRRDVLA